MQQLLNAARGPPTPSAPWPPSAWPTTSPPGRAPPPSWPRRPAATPTLARFLRTLAALGLCATDGEGAGAPDPRGEMLRSDAPGSVRPYALAIHAPHVERAWDGLPEAVRTGQPAFPIHGRSLWDYLAAHPEQQALFDAAMTAGADVRARALLAARDLTALGTLVDVGGGQGRLLAAALAAHPNLRGVLFDRPEVLPGRRRSTAAGVRDRRDLVGGDFFDAVPAGATPTSWP